MVQRLAFVLCLTVMVSMVSASTLAANGSAYPTAARGNHVDDYHGVKVSDPYRWMEDLDSPQTQAWVSAENALTEQYLAAIPARQKIHDRLKAIWNHEKFGVPFKAGSSYFYFKNSGLQNQSVLYMAPSIKAKPRVLLDPNTLCADGTLALGPIAVSDDGKLLAYSTQASGSDWQEWRIRTIASGEDYPEVIKWSKFSGAAWLPDGSGFYYNRYAEPKSATQFKDANYFQKVYFHQVGTPQSQDTLVYERKDHKEWGFGASVSEDGHYLLLAVSQGTAPKNLVFYKDLRQPHSAFIPLVTAFDAEYSFLNNSGSVFWFKTDKDAPRGRIIALDVVHPAAASEVIPQSKDTIESAGVVGDAFVLSYLQDAHAQVRVFDLNGHPLHEVALPGLGSVGGFGGKRRDRETFYAYTGYTNPTTIYRLDMTSGKSTMVFEPKVDFNPAEYVTEQVFYTSKDGTRVPMFINHKKDLTFDGSAPAILYGYGGFDIPLTPAFSVAVLTWMEMGGVYVVANLRGGSEYGEDWHQAGMLGKKQNVFDDFIAAADYLVVHKYTSRAKLAINGGSNGGLLVGAVMTQRPDLCAAAIPEVGVLDMLRFQKFTIGWAWTSDYGSSDDPQQFKWLFAYSPLHNLKPGVHYPATLIMTADHDDRVFPAHSFKFAATLQYEQAGPAPILIRLESKAGHGAGKPTTKLIDSAADKFAFLVKVLNIGGQS